MSVITIDLPETAEQQLARFAESFGTEPGCSFADQNWDYPAFLLGPPHLMCATHHEVGDYSIYAAAPARSAACAGSSTSGSSRRSRTASTRGSTASLRPTRPGRQEGTSS